MPTYEILTPIYLKILGNKSFEHFIRLGINVLEEEIIEEIKQYVISRQNRDGGFSDKAGNSDMYYSLFGYWLCKELDLKTPLRNLREFVLKNEVNKAGGQVEWICMVILFKVLIADRKGQKFSLNQKMLSLKQKIFSDEQQHAYKYQKESKNQQKLFKKKHNEFRKKRKAYRKALRKLVFENPQASENYFPFLGLMAFYYLKDYSSVLKLIAAQQPATVDIRKNLPTPVLAANLILASLAVGKKIGRNRTQERITQIKQALIGRYHESGGFRAALSSPLPDLLSTSVALYALNFANVNVSLYKPSCFEFVNMLYKQGGFVATVLDKEPDIEYSFYGLLALGALTSAK